jgi:NADPH:quinone reductase-like Zn-dependent oxidoreductase
MFIFPLTDVYHLLVRPQVNRMLEFLTNLGGDINIDDSYLNSPGFQDIMKDLPEIKLALNSVGGEVVTDFARILPKNGVIVTYGGMSKKKIAIPPELLAYKQLSLQNFWMYDWYRSHSKAEKSAMINELAGLVRDKKLTFFFESHDFDDFDYALNKSLEPFQFRKVVLNMDYPDRMKEHDMKDDKAYEIFEGPMV